MDRIKAIAKLLPASSKHKNMLLDSRYKFYHISEKLTTFKSRDNFFLVLFM